MKGVYVLALYIAIIGLATVIGILLNYRTNPVFTACKIVGSVAVLIAGALSLCFVINPYLFNDFRELVICFALTAVALIAAYIAAQYFEYRAQAKNKAQDQTPAAKTPAQESHWLNKRQSMFPERPKAQLRRACSQ